MSGRGGGRLRRRGRRSARRRAPRRGRPSRGPPPPPSGRTRRRAAPPAACARRRGCRLGRNRGRGSRARRPRAADGRRSPARPGRRRWRRRPRGPAGGARASPARIGAASAPTHPRCGSQSSSVKQTTSPLAAAAPGVPSRRRPPSLQPDQPRPGLATTSATSSRSTEPSSTTTISRRPANGSQAPRQLLRLDPWSARRLSAHRRDSRLSRWLRGGASRHLPAGGTRAGDPRVRAGGPISLPQGRRPRLLESTPCESC